MAIFTNEVEQQVLGGILNNQDLYFERATVLSQDLFAHEVNALIYSAIASAHARGEGIDRVTLTNRLKNAGINFGDKGIEINDYCDLISRFKPGAKDLDSSIKRLVTLSAKRFLVEAADRLKKSLLKDDNMTVSQMEELAGKALTDSFSKVANESDTIDLFDGLYEEIEERGNMPIEELGYKTPYAKIDEACPILKVGSTTVIAARTGNGKSSLLLDLAYNASVLNDAETLFLDGEMDIKDSRDRLAASITGVPLAYIATGKWRSIPEFVRMVRESGAKEKMKHAKLHFKFMPSSDIDSMRSVTKRWYYSKVGKDGTKKGLFVYDYIKIHSDESSSKSAQEYVLMGDKINAINTLVSKDCPMPALSACQNNRSNTDEKGKIRDDAGSIGGSDRILQYSSCVAILRRKSEEEFQEEGAKYGTHRMVWIKQRHQGFAAAGHQEFIKANDGRFVRNFVNLEIKNFRVKEIGLGEDMYAELAKNTPPQKRQDKKQGDKESF